MARRFRKMTQHGFRTSFLLVVVAAVLLSIPLTVRYLQNQKIIPSKGAPQTEDLYVAPALKNNPDFEKRTGKVIIKFKDSMSASAVNDETIYKKIGGKLSRKTSFDRMVVVDAQGVDPEKLAANYNTSELVEYAEVEGYVYAVYYPNDPMYVPHPDQQWSLDKIQSNYAWDLSKGDNIVVAVVDSGIMNHPDVASKVIKRRDIVAEEEGRNASSEMHFHGTHVAGIVGAYVNNNLGMASTGHNVKLIDVRVLNDDGQGEISGVVDGIKWAADNGAHVINMSFGGYFDYRSLKQAIDYAWSKGAILACAAGNQGDVDNKILYPAAYPNCLSVAATDKNDNTAYFSSKGAPTVDVAAPGVSIYSLYKDNTYAAFSGTSMATPHVAAVASLIKAKNPSWNNAQIRSQIENTAEKVAGSGKDFTYGRVNAFRALRPYPPACPKINYRRCNSSTQVEFSWEANWWAQKYIIRLNKYPYTDWRNQQAGDQWLEVYPPFQGTRWTQAAISPNTNYQWDIQEVENGVGGARCPYEQFRCQ